MKILGSLLCCGLVGSNSHLPFFFPKNYGFKEGKGLGKYQDGIVEPIEASKQMGRRGFGYESEELKEVIEKYDPDSCKVSVDETHKVVWLQNENRENFSKELLKSWVKMGPRLKGIDANSLFCDSNIVAKVLANKSVLDSITPTDMRNGKKRSNPFETISKAIFLNRAAMKMANMDAILDWMFTNPKNVEGKEIIGPNDLLYFADVCAGPGGFSEYVLYRKNWRAKGFGFTLRAHNDFELDQFIAGPCETFEPHYGVGGKEADGDVYRPENQESFRDYVLNNTDGKGVHFMMADGGIEIKNNLNDQEIICKKLYLCQCLVALLVVRTNGHFVVKLFDLFTNFSVGLVYLMYRCFRQILIIKPNTSRPANSERYLVCKWKRGDCDDVTKHLFEINKKVPDPMTQPNEDVLELVPTNVLLGDKPFFDYIKSLNNKIGEDQAAHLIKLATFSENTDLKDVTQADYRKKCLEKWHIPDTARTEPKCDPQRKWKEITCFTSPAELEKSLAGKNVNSLDTFKKHIRSVYDWYGLVISGEKNNHSRTFYLGLGRNNVYKVGIVTGHIPVKSYLHNVGIYRGDLWGSLCKKDPETVAHIIFSFITLAHIAFVEIAIDPNDLNILFIKDVHLYVGGKWVKWNDGPATKDVIGLCLPPYSLVYGELVKEFYKEGKSQIRTYSFHIIDAIRLGKEDISSRPFKERWSACKLFAKALKNDKFSICVKDYVELKDIKSLFDKVVLRVIKGSSFKVPCISLNEDTFWKAGGVMFLRDTRDTWSRCYSVRQSRYYMYGGEGKNSVFEDEADEKVVYGNFEASFRSAMIGWLEEIEKDNLLEYVKEQITKTGYKSVPLI